MAPASPAQGASERPVRSGHPDRAQALRSALTDVGSCLNPTTAASELIGIQPIPHLRPAMRPQPKAEVAFSMPVQFHARSGMSNPAFAAECRGAFAWRSRSACADQTALKKIRTTQRRSATVARRPPVLSVPESERRSGRLSIDRSAAKETVAPDFRGRRNATDAPRAVTDNICGDPLRRPD